MKPGEVQLSCPRCGHASFYFNTRKGVGFCHRAKCSWSPTRSQIEKWMKDKGKRFQVDDPGPAAQPEIDPEATLSYPPDVVPLLRDDLSAHCEGCEQAVQRIEQDRHVPRERQHHFGLRSSENRIYVPVVENMKLVNYVGRVKWWINSEAPRYQYATGSPISTFLYTWDVFRSRDRMVLVENTFNALWLRAYGVTTNFGSNLSEEQLTKIERSRLRQVLILWDEGAEAKAEKAVKNLRSRAVSAAYVRLEGQPDGHREECLVSVVQGGFEALERGEEQPINVRHKPCVR